MGKRRGTSAFPVARIKKMMQSDEDVGKIATTTPALVGKALECMVEDLLTTAALAAQSRRVKSVSPAHLREAVESSEKFDFLRSILGRAPLPEPIDKPIPSGREKASDAVASDGDLSRGQGGVRVGASSSTPMRRVKSPASCIAKRPRTNLKRVRAKCEDGGVTPRLVDPLSSFPSKPGAPEGYASNVDELTGASSGVSVVTNALAGSAAMVGGDDENYDDDDDGARTDPLMEMPEQDGMLLPILDKNDPLGALPEHVVSSSMQMIESSNVPSGTDATKAGFPVYSDRAGVTVPSVSLPLAPRSDERLPDPSASDRVSVHALLS